ncbi:Protein of unknown function [Gryllus bimaculatus]|nr:Protein of unknown function [Gryllus bimaculatus]
MSERLLHFLKSRGCNRVGRLSGRRKKAKKKKTNRRQNNCRSPVTAPTSWRLRVWGLSTATVAAAAAALSITEKMSK